MTADFKITDADSPAQIDLIRELFRGYARSLSIDLCFQNFEQEVSALPGRYAPPAGRLLLGMQGGEAVGCVALRKLEDGICEMKRLYVRPIFRRSGAGRQLAEVVIKAAREAGYLRMRLDTLAEMKPAIALYEALGFQRIAAYYPNPIPETVYLELELRG